MKIGWESLKIDGKTIPLSFACKQSICKSADESECFRMSKLVWSFTGEMNESENCKQNEIWMSIGEVERSEVQRIIPLLISLEYKGNELFSASYRHFWWSAHLISLILMLSVNNKREESRRNENKIREDINERKEDKRLKKEILILSVVSP